MRARMPRFAVPVALSGVLAAGLLLTAAVPVAAGTADDMEASILRWVNADRAARGLKPLYRDGRLADLANDRAAILASKRVLSHSAAGDIAAQLNARDIQWFRYGENIGYTGYKWGSEAAAHLYRMWKGSESHWKLMMSPDFNYLGVGMVYRSSTRETWSAILFTESLDRTPAYAETTSAARWGSTVKWTWWGWDRKLQTHTAGLKDFDVQYRVDGGEWVWIFDNTTSTSLRLYERRSGHTYSVRVRARDQRGNIGAWSPELRISVP
jgi:uncharacterized protein YkwD